MDKAMILALIQESGMLLAGLEHPSDNPVALQRATAILMEASSPVTTKYTEKLFQSVIDRKYVDYDDIDKSHGRIEQYIGYGPMTETLTTIQKLATEQNATEVVEHVNVVLKTISRIKELGVQFESGYGAKCDYVMMEYATLVYTCVEATSALLYCYVDYVRRPDKPAITIRIRNSKTRANTLFFDQLRKFNRVQDTMGIDYAKMLEKLVSNDRKNFVGDVALGYAALSVIAIAAVPITRELVYQFYGLRGRLSKELKLQADFLEMNRASVENNDFLDPARRSKILQKQENLAKTLRRLSDVLRVEMERNKKKAVAMKKKDAPALSEPNIRESIANDDIVLF